MTFRILASLLLSISTLTFAQDLPNAPSPKIILATNAVNIGSTFFMARAIRSGAAGCVIEAHRYTPALAYQPNPSAKYMNTLKIQLPIDAAVFFTTWKLRKSHPNLATWLPLVSSGFQFGIGASQYNSGCS